MLRLNSKQKIAVRTVNDRTKIVKVRVPLEYLKAFWRPLEMSSINCEINFVLTWSNRCFKTENPIADEVSTFTITDTKLYVLYQLKIMTNCLNN